MLADPAARPAAHAALGNSRQSSGLYIYTQTTLFRLIIHSIQATLRLLSADDYLPEGFRAGMEAVEARLRAVDEEVLSTEAELKNARKQDERDYYQRTMLQLRERQTLILRQQTLLLQKQLSIPHDGEHSNCGDSVCVPRRAACSALYRPACQLVRCADRTSVSAKASGQPLLPSLIEYVVCCCYFPLVLSSTAQAPVSSLTVSN